MKRVVIIGAGPAGLTAAHEILSRSKDYEVVVLEETGEIGGISRTVRHNGNRMDIGGHRFFSKDPRVSDWWEKMMPTQGAPTFDDKRLGRTMPLAEGGPDPEKEDRVMLVRHRVSRIYYLRKFFDYPISLKVKTLKNLGARRTLVGGFSYLKSMCVKRPEDSLENFYINRFGKSLYSMFFEGYTEKLWGRHPSQIAADWGAQRVKGLSVTAILKDMFARAFGKKDRKVETSLIEQFYYPKFGPGQLWETAAAEVEKMGGTLLMEARVTAVRIEGNRVVSVSYMKDGRKEELTGDEFISSMPVKDLILGMEGDEPDFEVKRIAGGLPYRDFVTVGLLVPRLNLKNDTDMKTLANIVPDCWIYVQDTDVKLGRIQIFNNWSPYLVEDPEKTVWIGLEYFCDEGDDFWNMSDEACIAFAADELERMGIIRASDVIDAHREKVKKAYPAYFDTYYEIDRVIDYLNTLENLYCVGRNGQHRYNNMDHSMATAFLAADNILAGVRDKANIWAVNTDQEYHEEKNDG
ncbi:NAD(P)/FAD-dependent oxidoreductase [Gehongia tenuis]|uniref:NAD(P)/FAD-dependent oxidoreductase n=1 Tax=Gehongia tenuis TaxID=2763655 RepID=A0A926D383_9FIRM|nr:NAD(P)/FAD-dependent oxidoreductase [Gehongia tenuis]